MGNLSQDFPNCPQSLTLNRNTQIEIHNRTSDYEQYFKENI